MRGKLSILALWFPLLTYAQSGGQNYVKETSYLDSLGSKITNVRYGDKLSISISYLSYADGMGTPCYNGNVSVLQWKNSTYYCPRGYKFTYDVNNRMTNALYCEGNELERPVGRFNEFVGYDLNGNITSLQREGYRDGGYGIIDDLSIGLSGNQVTHVTDAAEESISEGSLDFNGESSYKYNAFGALESDSGRGITRIDYDDNQNPARIQFSNGNVTKYVYSAEGEKLRTIYYTAMPNISVADGDIHELTTAETLAVDSVDYLLGGNLILKNGRIERYLFDGGYFEARALNLSSDDFLFYYYTKDHIGNNREVVDRYGSVCQTIDYYPYGTPYGDPTTTSNASFQPFKYNGKEFDMMHGLNTYDYGARQYNPIVPTWDRMDNLCEQQAFISPYNYCLCNPVNYVDPNGNDQYEVNGLGMIVNRIEDKQKDAFYRVNKLENGSYTRTGAQLVLPYSTISTYGRKKDVAKKPYSYFVVNSSSAGKSLFEFLADNTVVEWTQYVLSTSDGNIISTVSSAHDTDSDASSGAMQDFIFSGNYSVKEHIHNHPAAQPVEMPSGLLPDDSDGDIFFARKLNSKLLEKHKGIPNYRLYINKKYINWNVNSKPTDFGRAADGTWLPTLPEVICHP